MDALPPPPYIEQHDVTERGESPVYYRLSPPLHVAVFRSEWGVASRLGTSSFDSKAVFTYAAAVGGRFEIGRATWRPLLGVDAGYRFIGSDGNFFAPAVLAGAQYVANADTAVGLFVRGAFLYGEYGGVAREGFQIAAVAELGSASGTVALALAVDSAGAFQTIGVSFAWNFYLPWRSR